MTIAKVATSVLFMCAALGLMPDQAHALSPAELLIFDALTVQSSRLGNTQVAQKNVGGLVCERYQDESPVTASCSLGEVDRDDEAIYNALNIPAVDVTEPGRRDYVVYEKSVGGLVCTMAHAVGANPVRPYARCTLN